MRTNLRAGAEIRKLMSEYEKHRKSKDYAAVMDQIKRANWEQMEVEKKMCAGNRWRWKRKCVMH